MLSLMRKHAGTWLIKVILGAIVIVFIFWGVGSYTSQRSARVATVNGTSITLKDFRAAYDKLVKQARQSFGNRLNDEMIKSLKLRKRALDQLIDKILMLQAAEKLDFRVSDAELAQSIRSFKAFQTGGRFDSRRYYNVLSRNHLTPEAFEILQKDALLMEKLRTFVTSSVMVSDAEALAWYQWNNLQVSILFVKFEPGRYKDLAPSTDALKKFFEAHKEAYKTEPQLKASYVRFNPEDYVDRVPLSEDELRDYYESNLDEFKSPKTVTARHILIRVAPDAKADEVARARKKIEGILKQARQGKDFAALAKKYSEGPSRDQGGFLGTFRRETMVKPFADKAFSMQAGQISDPVRTRFGWHIIKVEKVNPATVKSFKQARSAIEKKLKLQRARNLAYDAAEAFYDALSEGDVLKTAAEQENIKVVTTDFFTRAGPHGIKKPGEFAKTAFDLPEKEISDIQDFGDGYYLLQVVAKVPSQIPALKTVEAKVKADWIRQNQDKKAQQDAAAFLAALKKGRSLQSEARKFGVKPQKSGLFRRNASIEHIGFEPDISRAAFALTAKNKLPENVLKGQKGYYVIEFDRSKPAGPEGFEKDHAAIKARLLQQKKFKIFEAWLTQTRKDSKIVIQEDFLQG